ncbi:MFS multidrug transporter [Phlyctema vagabunda]|uniref:MFS multidrug transporter n=1 Tax=Phlyctema vagabunda TaxID=108571 RepID=A0ABR4PSY6_9HELO
MEPVLSEQSAVAQESDQHNSGEKVGVKGESENGQQNDISEFRPDARFYLAFSSLTVLAMMVSLDGTSVSVALPIITQDLNGSAIEAFWTGTSFLLSAATFQLPIAALSGVYGRMPLLSFCIVSFLVGIIVSARGQDFTAMLVGRTIQGIGGGGIILMNDLLITDLVPLRQRGKYFGIIAGIWALGSNSGPVLGGVLAFKSDWRWIFQINIPFAVISLIMVPLFVRLRVLPGSLKEKFQRIDILGNTLFIAATSSFLIPLTWGGVQYSWTSWRTLVPLILGVAGFAGFAIFEKKVPKFPIIRLDLVFGNYNMAFSLFAALINALLVYGSLYFLPLYYEGVQGYNPVISGVAMFPATLTVAPFAIISGIIIEKAGDFRIITIFGWVTTTLGMGVVILLDIDTTIIQWVFLSFCSGVGLGILYTSLAFVNQSAAGEESMTFAVGMFIFARSLGQCIGVAICGVIFQNQMFRNLRSYPELAGRARDLSKDASSLVLQIFQMDDGVEKQNLIKAYADSLKVVWAVLCALSGLALVGSLFVKKVDLNRELASEQMLRPAKEKEANTLDLEH